MQAFLTSFSNQNLLSDGLSSFEVSSTPSISEEAFFSASSLNGFGADANSRSFAESLSVRAVSTGPNTFAFNLALLDLIVLARAPFAIVPTI